jgi:hypothetical protein
MFMDENLSLIAARSDLKRIEGREGEMYVFNLDSHEQKQQKDSFLSGYENRVTTPRFSRFHGEVNPDVFKKYAHGNIHILGETKNKGAPYIITSPKIRYYAKSAGNGEDKLAKYPFVNWTAFAENGNGLKIPFYYAIKKALTPIKKNLESYVMSGGDLITNMLIYPVVSGIQNLAEQQFGAKSQEVFPKFRAWYDFSRGASTIERLYTVAYTVGGVTREFPLYITAGGDPQPTDDKLESGIKTVIDDHKSPLNGTEIGGEFYRSDFSLIGAEKYTRGDFKKLVEPGFFRKWFIRDDTWLIQQYGERDLTLERDVLVNGTTHHVNVYKRPSEFLYLIYWGVGDKIYDIIDTPYDPLQKYIEKRIPKQAQQILLRDEYKTIAGVRRGLFNTARTPLEYDMT